MSYCRDYILIGNFVVMVLLPFLLLCFLNSGLYHFISKRVNVATTRQKRDQGIATILIIIVAVFGCCNIPRVVTNLYEVGSNDLKDQEKS